MFAFVSHHAVCLRLLDAVLHDDAKSTQIVRCSNLGFARSCAALTCRQWPTLASMQGKILFVVINTYAAQYLAQASDPHFAALSRLRSVG